MEPCLSDKIQSFVSQQAEQDISSGYKPSTTIVDSPCWNTQKLENLPDTTDLEIILREQLAALNNLATRFITRANACVTSQHQINVAEKYANTGIKLVNAIRAGMETLSRLQNRGKQTILVQHIRVEGDAKAMIAGSINKSGGGDKNIKAGGDGNE